MMRRIVLSLLLVTVGAEPLTAATVTKFAKKQKLIEVSGDTDELLGITVGDSVEISFDETVAAGVVKKVLAGNRLHVELQADTEGMKKGLKVGIVRKELTTPVEDGEPDAEVVEKPSATITRVGKNRIAVRPNQQWDADLRALTKGEKIKVFLNNRTEPVLLSFDKAGRNTVEFLFRKKDRAAMVKGVELMPYQEEQTDEAPPTDQGRAPLPWYTEAGAAGLFSLEGMFFDAGYLYSDLATTYEVDKNTDDDTTKVNGVLLGARANLGTFRIGLEAGRATQKDSLELEVTNAVLSFAAASPYVNVGFELIPYSATAKTSIATSKGDAVSYRLVFGWSRAMFGFYGSYLPPAKAKVKTTYSRQLNAEIEDSASTVRSATEAEAGFWFLPAPAFRVKLHLANNYNDGGVEEEGEFVKEEKVLANERLSFSLGGSWVGETGLQFSAGLARNRPGLQHHSVVYNAATPSTGVYLGLAKVSGPFVVGTGLEYQSGGIVKENEEEGYDVTTTGLLKLFSLTTGLVF